MCEQTKPRCLDAGKESQHSVYYVIPERVPSKSVCECAWIMQFQPEIYAAPQAHSVKRYRAPLKNLSRTGPASAAERKL